MIEVRPEIMTLLESFGASMLKSSSNKSACARSLALLKKNRRSALELILKLIVNDLLFTVIYRLPALFSSR